MTMLVGTARLRRPAWRPAPAPVAPVVDDGPDRLRAIATIAGQQARAVLLARVTATCSGLHRRGYRAAANDRVWRIDSGEKPCWCVLDECSQRALLEHVLAGPGAPSPTAVERTIIGECAGRLLAVAASDAWSETGKGPPCDDAWECSLDIGGANGKNATLSLYTVAEPEPSARCLVCIDDVPVDLAAGLNGIGVSLSEMARWTRGSIVPLGQMSNDLRATLAAQRGPLALCVVGESSGRRAVCLLRLQKVSAP